MLHTAEKQSCLHLEPRGHGPQVTLFSDIHDQWLILDFAHAARLLVLSSGEGRGTRSSAQSLVRICGQ